MRCFRTAALASLLVASGFPAHAQVAPPGPSSAGIGARLGVSGIPRGAAVVPGTPRWGGGPPPPAPFDRLLGSPSALTTPRPGVDEFRARPDTYAPRYSSGSRGDRTGPRDGRRRYNRDGGFTYPRVGAVFYGVSPYFYYPQAAAPVAQAAAPLPPDAPEGFLRLVVTPRAAGVFVDGVYEGAVDDFGGRGEHALAAGIHSVRIEAEGFEPVAFDVRVPANDTITLRRDLEPRRTPPPPVAQAPGPTTAPGRTRTIYVIPRCYLGDSRPEPSQLPAGCSLADLRTMD